MGLRPRHCTRRVYGCANGGAPAAAAGEKVSVAPAAASHAVEAAPGLSGAPRAVGPKRAALRLNPRFTGSAPTHLRGTTGLLLLLDAPPPPPSAPSGIAAPQAKRAREARAAAMAAAEWL